MMRSNERTLLLAAALLAAAPLHADWLVTVDGAEIETEGPWKVEGSQVVFTIPGGSLASLPAAEVDLAASEARTRPAAAPAETTAEPAATARSRWVLTDADVAHAWPGGAATEPESGEGGEAAAAAPAARGLAVASWEEVDPSEVPSGVALRGTVHNTGGDVATDVAVEVVLYDADGGLLELRTTRPTSTTLEPDQRSDFRIDFPDVTHYEGVQFTVEARTLATGDAAAGGGEEE